MGEGHVPAGDGAAGADFLPLPFISMQLVPEGGLQFAIGGR